MKSLARMIELEREIRLPKGGLAEHMAKFPLSQLEIEYIEGLLEMFSSMLDLVSSVEMYEKSNSEDMKMQAFQHLTLVKDSIVQGKK